MAPAHSTPPFQRDFWNEDEELEPLEEPVLEERHATWRKDVSTQPRSHVSFPPRPTPSQPIPAVLRAVVERRIPPVIFFWTSLGLILVLIFGGIFGVMAAFGHTSSVNASDSSMSLQVSPRSAVVGATITLRGAHFTPHGRVGLTRDTSVPIADTGGSLIMQVDGDGNFTDTVVVGQWGNGLHVINAEDAILHKIASFPVLISGQSAILRPAHLLASQTSLDLGSGDQATNSAKIVNLDNIGGGQLSWQASSSAAWLQTSPNSGTLYSGIETQLTVVADRSNMQPGQYTAQLTITSNAGEATLPVHMAVTPLQASHQAAIQLGTAVLNFSAVDGSRSPGKQTLTLRNPGAVALGWKARASASWLVVSPSSDTLNATGSEPVAVFVNTSTLLPGTYNGVITFSAQGPAFVKDGIQSVYVSVTITPRCGLQLAPAELTFAGAYQQGTIPAKTINVGTAQSCSSAVQWSAATDAHWLTLDKSNGTTPATPVISVNPAGMQPGVYNASLRFSSANGVQIIPVTFTLGQSNEPVMNAGPADATFHLVLGSGQQQNQNIRLTNSGGSALQWHIATTTATGGSWLRATPTGGTLAAKQSAVLQVQSTVLSAMSSGTYTGDVVITGLDSAGKVVVGSPQRIPVSLVVVQPCTISVPPALNFSSVVGQPAPGKQNAFVQANGSCAHALTWTASSSASWLTLSSTTGSVTTAKVGSLSVGVNTSGLAAGTYQGRITVSAQDSVTHTIVGTTQSIMITLVVQPGCTLNNASTAQLNYKSAVGTNPADQTFTVGVGGTCAGNALVTPMLTLKNGTGWLNISPASALLASGQTATFTVSANASTLAAGDYTGSITLEATNNGVTLANSPQAVGVDLNVAALPALAASPQGATVNITTGTTAQPITISNTGGMSLNWTAALSTDSPSFVTLSAASGNGLAGGGSTTINLNVDATNVVGGQSYTAKVLITAIDPASGQAVAGSPVTIPVTINVASPSMQLNATRLAFSTAVGNDPASQLLAVSNAGGNNLQWAASNISASWLVVAPGSGVEQAGATTNMTVTVHSQGLAPGSYSASMLLKPSVGSAVQVTVLLSITDTTAPAPTPAAAKPRSVKAVLPKRR